MISYRRVRKESDELLCTVRSLVTVRNQLPGQVVKRSPIRNGEIRNREDGEERFFRFNQSGQNMYYLSA